MVAKKTAVQRSATTSSPGPATTDIGGGTSMHGTPLEGVHETRGHARAAQDPAQDTPPGPGRPDAAPGQGPGAAKKPRTHGKEADGPQDDADRAQAAGKSPPAKRPPAGKRAAAAAPGKPAARKSATKPPRSGARPADAENAPGSQASAGQTEEMTPGAEPTAGKTAERAARKTTKKRSPRTPRKKTTRTAKTTRKAGAGEAAEEAATAQTGTGGRKPPGDGTGTRPEENSAVDDTAAAAAEEAAQAAKTTGATKVVAKKTPGTATTAQTPTAVSQARLSAAEPDELAVRPGEEPWTREEVDEARAELTAEALRLRTELESSQQSLAGLMRDSGDGAGDDDADTGSKNITREHELALAANAREMLEQTERALDRLDAGTYGLCENCGNPIGKARMQAFPRATLCVECKQKQERRS